MLARRISKLSDTDRLAAHAGVIQRAQLRDLLSRAASTEFGVTHGFAALSELPDEQLARSFRAAVPIQQYADLRPMLERMRTGAEPDVTWPGVVMDWAQTSGTTAGDKYVPISRDLLRHNMRAALDIYAHAARFGMSLPDLFAGKALFLGGSSDLAVNEHGVRTGDLSGVVTRMIRWPMSAVWLPGKEIALESDWPRKIDLMAERCLDEDVRWISGMPSWSIVLFERMIELARQRGRDVNCLRDLWPNLRLFVHGGVKYDPFDRRVRAMWTGDPDGPDLPNRLEVYAASEAFVAIQDTPGDSGMRLNIDHNVFYEFIPASEIGSPDPPAFTCDEVEPGERYVVVMSTCGGLWRYDIGDVVVFDTVPPAGPPRLRIVGRSKHFMNAFGENIIAEHVELAVAEASRKVGVEVGEFTAAPLFPEPGRSARVELIIEWPDMTPEPGRPRPGQSSEDDNARLARFAELVDRGMQARSNDYAAKRAGDLGMGPLEMTPVPLGTFHRWLESRGKLGGQHKCPRCAMDRTHADAILSVAVVPA